MRRSVCVLGKFRYLSESNRFIIKIEKVCLYFANIQLDKEQNSTSTH